MQVAANGGCLERERTALVAEVDPRAPSEGSIADDEAAALEEAEERDWEESVQPSPFSSSCTAGCHGTYYSIHDAPRVDPNIRNGRGPINKEKLTAEQI